ncbi:MAG: hypothetical protein ACLUEJ_07695 [Clostridium sp.]
MSNTGERILPVSRYYDSLNGMKRKYDRLARQEAFSGTNVEEWTGWKNKEKKRLWELLGMDKMEICSPCPEIAERVMLDGGILRKSFCRWNRYMDAGVSADPAGQRTSFRLCPCSPWTSGGGKIQCGRLQ